MKAFNLILAACALGLAACGESEQPEADTLQDENAELTARVEELEGKLEEARTAADEVEGDSAALGLALASIEAESDGFGGLEVDKSDAELAHSSLESSVGDLQAAVAE